MEYQDELERMRARRQRQKQAGSRQNGHPDFEQNRQSSSRQGKTADFGQADYRRAQSTQSGSRNVKKTELDIIDFDKLDEDTTRTRTSQASRRYGSQHHSNSRYAGGSGNASYIDSDYADFDYTDFDYTDSDHIDSDYTNSSYGDSGYADSGYGDSNYADLSYISGGSRRSSSEQGRRRERNQDSAVRRATVERRKARKKKKRKILLFEFLLLGILVMGAWFLLHKKQESGYWTVAVFGVDSRDGNLEKDTHSDVEMICVVNRETGEIRLASVFRDTYMQVSSEGKYHKINQAYFDGGHDQAIEALNQNLDLKIDDYATFNWKAVADAITILGGIDLEISDSEFAYINGFITETVESTGLGSHHLEHAGMNHLDGVQAVAYARLRLMDTDYNRTARQRLVISLAMEKAKQADLKTLTTVVNAVLPQISTSIGIDDLLPMAKNISKYHIGETAGFPFSRGETNIGKKDCVIPLTLESNVIQLHQFLYDDMEYQPSSTVKQISAKIASDSGMGEVAENAPEAKVGGSGGSSSNQSAASQPAETAPAETPAEPETSAEESSGEDESETAEAENGESESDEGGPEGAGNEPVEIGPGINPGMTEMPSEESKEDIPLSPDSSVPSDSSENTPAAPGEPNAVPNSPEPVPEPPAQNELTTPPAGPS